MRDGARMSRLGTKVGSDSIGQASRREVKNERKAKWKRSEARQGATALTGAGVTVPQLPAVTAAGAAKAEPRQGWTDPGTVPG